MKTSSFFSLNWKDAGKGLIMAVLGAVVGMIYGMISAGQFTFVWKDIWHVAAAAAATYIMKNLFTNSNDQFLKTDNNPQYPPYNRGA